jgi:hypothetical protein
LSGISAAYSFAVPAAGGSPAPLVTLTFLDGLGNPIPAFDPDNPIGFWNGNVTVSQSVGLFTVPAVLGSNPPPPTPENSASLGLPYPYQLTEVGDGSTNVFSTTLTFSAPNFALTQTEFPQLNEASWGVPYPTASLQLTCQFLTPAPTTDPCPGTQPATFTIN